jgi:hypothetical protein
MLRSRFLATSTAAGILLMITACGGSDTIKPAAHADDPACSVLVNALPVAVLGQPINQVNVAGVGSWGDPAIVLRCGVTPPGPTTHQCLQVDGLDWVYSETKEAYTFITYGRNPGVEVTVPLSVPRTNASSALVDLATAVKPVPTTSQKCVGLGDTN